MRVDKNMGQNKAKLERTVITTSRLMDFCSEKELVAQTGHSREEWSLVVLKELMDNALDACEDENISPEIDVEVSENSIRVADNGPGIPAETVQKILDFSVRVSSREAYVAPDRGAQGNALKTILTMPFVLDHGVGRVDITARGIRHAISIKLDSIRQEPIVAYNQEQSFVSERKRPQFVKNGTQVQVFWPDSACSILADAKTRFLQIADDYTFLNPHLTLHLNWMGDEKRIEAIDRDWMKWRPNEPTSPHWYEAEHLTRLIGAYIAHDRDRGSDRTVREFIAEFRGLSSTAKQKKVLDATGLGRVNLSVLANDHEIDRRKVESLLSAMQDTTKPVKPINLGVIGRDNLAAKFEKVGCEMESFDYKKVASESEDGLPFVLETAFGWCEKLSKRRLVLGVNWSPGILNPFRQLGKFGQSLDSILEQQRVGQHEPVVFLLHCAYPRVEYMDRGKSSVVIGGKKEDDSPDERHDDEDNDDDAEHENCSPKNAEGEKEAKTMEVK